MACLVSLWTFFVVLPGVNTNIFRQYEYGGLKRKIFVRLFVCVYKIKRIAHKLFTLLYKAVLVLVMETHFKKKKLYKHIFKYFKLTKLKSFVKVFTKMSGSGMKIMSSW